MSFSVINKGTFPIEATISLPFANIRPVSPSMFERAVESQQTVRETMRPSLRNISVYFMLICS